MYSPLVPHGEIMVWPQLSLDKLASLDLYISSSKQMLIEAEGSIFLLFQ